MNFFYLSGMKRLPLFLDDFLGLFYPGLCITCGQRLVSQEKYVCLNCWQDLPVNHFHMEPDNKVAQLFWGRVWIEHATSFFSYRAGSKYQRLIHSMKYKGMKELGFEAGQRFGYVLNESAGFLSIDGLVPVPLHRRKQRRRGYNQSEWIARGLAEAMHKPVEAGYLFRKKHTPTQTKKNRMERWQNVEGIFDIYEPRALTGKHLLLVDDVVTTGATLEACAAELLKIDGVRVSIVTLAFAEQ